MKAIAIIGAGWLGKPLAQYLDSIGHQVWVTSTTRKGADTLAQSGFNAFVCDLNDAKELDTQLKQLNIEIIIGCFPPGFRKGYGKQYATQWQTLSQAAQKAKVNKLVMVSSTTVYPSSPTDMAEPCASLETARHNSQFSENALTMLEAEASVIQSDVEYAIVRCSGLVGPNRHPSNFVSKLKQVSDVAPANMLHLTDAIGAVSFAALQIKNEIVNATTPNTVNKAEFYQAALASVDSTEPLPSIVSKPDKRIIADKLIGLGYRFHFQHVLEII
ncbi:NAD-dependent epimerase/dehydratase family protein [Vibrio sp. TRT 17S01]|uniref:NAD-dependent epimerase/dehydratase family protein n=1 Tax=Vibrio sp. TRT 17S01 TaxID=3418505 RepID=UPI003CE760CF